MVYQEGLWYDSQEAEYFEASSVCPVKCKNKDLLCKDCIKFSFFEWIE